MKNNYIENNDIKIKNSKHGLDITEVFDFKPDNFDSESY